MPFIRSLILVKIYKLFCMLSETFQKWKHFSIGLITGISLSLAASLFFKLKRLDRTKIVIRRIRALNQNEFHQNPRPIPPGVEDWRMVMVVNCSLKMEKGKVASQCAHAAVAAYTKSLLTEPSKVDRWSELGGTKIVLKGNDDRHLEDLLRDARNKGLVATIIRDSGQTQIPPGSKTVLGIGPDRVSLLSEVTGNLKLY